MSQFEYIHATEEDTFNSTPVESVQLSLAPRSSECPYGPYIVSPELASVANIAIFLNQPVLLTGEPGTGKTSFAWAVARQLGLKRVLEFHTKSTSVAKDIFYTFDTLRRFHDASVGNSDAKDPCKYIEFQSLGTAIRSERTQVVLIDEVDKAPRDFPNDLLRELDRMEFQVPELRQSPIYRASVKHVVIITSNEERRLPMPFLRRCAHCHIPFPNELALRNIIQAHLNAVMPSESFIALVVSRFVELRSIPRLSKPPSTGELLGWASVLAEIGVSEADLRSIPVAKLPAMQTLIKQPQDLEVVERHR